MRRILSAFSYARGVALGASLKNRWYLVGIALGASLALVPALPASATTVGDILACYACNTTGNSAVDAALTANPSVANDGILFAFVNTSNNAITGGVFSVSGTSTVTDSFALPTIAANSTYILLPGLSDDGGVHLSGGLFADVGYTQDTSDGQGNVNDGSAFILHRAVIASGCNVWRIPPGRRCSDFTVSR
jgi:hypothetical protein